MFFEEKSVNLVLEAVELVETDPQKAKMLAIKALQNVNDSTNAELFCDAWEIIGRCDLNLGDPVSSSKASEKAIKYAYQLNDNYRLAKAIKTQGSSLIDMNCYPQAMDCFLKVHDLAEQNGYDLLKYQAYNNIAILHQLNGDYFSARSILTSILEKIEEVGLSPTIAYINLAEIHLHLLQPDKAIQFIREGRHAILRENKQHFNPVLLYLNGWFLLQKKRYRLAEILLKKALTAFEASHIYDDHVSCLITLTRLYQETKSWDNTVFWAKKSVRLAERFDLMYHAITATEILINALKEKNLTVEAAEACKLYVSFLNKRTELHKKRTRILMDMEWNMQQEKINHNRLARSLKNDPLTGLFSTRTLEPSVRELIENSDDNNKFALLYLDIDNLKNVNDTYGHDAGDRLLILFSNAIRQCLPLNGMAFRKSGDEFVVLLPLASIEDTSAFALHLLGKLKQSDFKIEEGVNASCSIGIALFPLDATTYIDLLNSADSAMYFVKRNGKGGYYFNSSERRPS